MKQCRTVRVFIIVLLFTTNALAQLPGNTTVPAILAFGDSFVDAGNNDNMVSLAKCNYPPYGIDFEGGVPTGRFSNGKVPPDILAEELGIKPSLPAYQDLDLTPEDLLTGVTFGSGGAGYVPLTTKIATAIPLSQQLKYFEEYIERLKTIVGEEKTKFIIENSLVVIICGTNDIANNYFTVSQLKYNVSTFTDIMADYARNFTEALYGYGARRILLSGAPPVGCLPSQRTLSGGPQRNCVDRVNDASKLFNTKIIENIDALSRNLRNLTINYFDIYNPLLDLILNPNQYGFNVTNLGCCGTGLIEVNQLCKGGIVRVCPKRSDYVFWDSIHPTETSYKIIVAKLLDSYSDILS